MGDEFFNGAIYFLIREFNPAVKQEVPTVFNENKPQPDGNEFNVAIFLNSDVKFGCQTASRCT